FFVARRRVGVLRWRPPYRKTCKDRDSPSPPVLRLYIRRHTPAVPLPPQPGRGSSLEGTDAPRVREVAVGSGRVKERPRRRGRSHPAVRARSARFDRYCPNPTPEALSERAESPSRRPRRGRLARRSRKISWPRAAGKG